MRYEVSVIVPAFNRARLLPETLRSIQEQSHKPSEIIVVDDGSADATSDAARSCGPDVRCLRIENSGPAYARHAGVMLSTSPWIAFCDSDDIWLPEKLERQIALIREVPELEFCFTDYRLFRENTWNSSSKFQEASQELWPGSFRRQTASNGWVFMDPLYPLLLSFVAISPVTVMMTRAFYDRVGGFDPVISRVVAEDLEFTLRCAQETPLGVVPLPLVGVRKHGANLSGNQLANLQGEITVIQYALAHHRDANVYRSHIEKSISSRAGQAAELAFSVPDFELTRRLCDLVRPNDAHWKLKVKSAVARMPAWLAGPAAEILARGSEWFKGKPHTA